MQSTSQIWAQSTFREILQKEYSTRRARNGAYSMRAFARDINMSPSRLSEVINGGQRISNGTASGIAQALGFSKTQRDIFCDLVDSENPRSKKIQSAARQRLKKHKLNLRVVREDVFTFISEWYDPALLELINVSGVTHSAQAFAAALNVQEDVITQAIQRLKRLKLLRTVNGKFVQSSRDFKTAESIPSQAIKKAHKGFLAKAVEALDAQKMEERRFDSLVLALNHNALPEAFAKIQAFCREFNQEFGSDEHNDALYCLGVQFYRLAERP